MEDLSKAIYLLDNITENMEWIKLLLEKDRFIAPLTTYDLVMKRLGQVKEIIKSNQKDCITPRQIKKAIKILEKPIKREKPYYVEVENPIESGDPIKEGTVINYKTIKNGIRFLSKYNNPFYCDSVGTEGLHEEELDKI